MAGKVKLPVPLNSFDSAALKAMAHRLDAMIIEHAEALANGAASMKGDASATALLYSDRVGFIRALRIMREQLQTIEDELLGRGPKS